MKKNKKEKMKKREKGGVVMEQEREGEKPFGFATGWCDVVMGWIGVVNF